MKPKDTTHVSWPTHLAAFPKSPWPRKLRGGLVLGSERFRRADALCWKTRTGSGTARLVPLRPKCAVGPKCCVRKSRESQLQAVMASLGARGPWTGTAHRGRPRRYGYKEGSAITQMLKQTTHYRPKQSSIANANEETHQAIPKPYLKCQCQALTPRLTALSNLAVIEVQGAPTFFQECK